MQQCVLAQVHPNWKVVLVDLPFDLCGPWEAYIDVVSNLDRCLRLPRIMLSVLIRM